MVGQKQLSNCAKKKIKLRLGCKEYNAIMTFSHFIIEQMFNIMYVELLNQISEQRHASLSGFGCAGLDRSRIIL